MGITPQSVKLPAEVQPGDRAPAPDRLELVQAFANSFWDLPRGRPEQFTSPAALAAWLRRRGLIGTGMRLSDSDLRRTLDVREGIRTLLFANSGLEPDMGAIDLLNRGLGGASLVVRLAPTSRPEFAAPTRDLDGALGLIAASVAMGQLEGRFERLKACPGPACGWAFYDHSRNLAGTWCSMSICGSRMKAREYRRRRRQARRA